MLRIGSSRVVGCVSAPRHSVAVLACRPLAAPCLHPQRTVFTVPSSSFTPPTLDGKLPPFADEVLRGVGQVTFCNSPTSGALMLASLCYGDPWLALLATAGTVSATATARTLGVDSGAISNGLAGYNGMLVGCAFSVFLGLAPGAPSAVAATIAGAALTVPATQLFGPACAPVPQWTWAFNATTLAFLLCVKPLAGAAAADPSVAIGLSGWLCAPLVGVSQIFVVGDAVSGALALGAIAAYSPGCALATLWGSTVGMGTAALLGAAPAEIGFGLWGFNPALTALAISVFYVPTPAAAALATGGAVATTALFGGMKGVAAGALGVPALTLPFCAVATLCYLAQGRAPGLVLAAAPHSPEKNTI